MDQWKGTNIGDEFLIFMVLLLQAVGFVFSKYIVENGFFLKSTALESTDTISKSNIAPYPVIL
jgi:hypothetical protein